MIDLLLCLYDYLFVIEELRLTDTMDLLWSQNQWLLLGIPLDRLELCLLVLFLRRRRGLTLIGRNILPELARFRGLQS